MPTYTVLLADGTVGQTTMNLDEMIGEIITVSLHDENGLPIEVEGRLEDILEEN